MQAKQNNDAPPSPHHDAVDSALSCLVSSRITATISAVRLCCVLKVSTPRVPFPFATTTFPRQAGRIYSSPAAQSRCVLWTWCPEAGAACIQAPSLPRLWTAESTPHSYPKNTTVAELSHCWAGLGRLAEWLSSTLSMCTVKPIARSLQWQCDRRDTLGSLSRPFVPMAQTGKRSRHFPSRPILIKPTFLPLFPNRSRSSRLD